MPRVLRDLKIVEVSSVDKGAGRGVKVLLIKRDAEAMPDGSFAIRTEADLKAAIAKADTDQVRAHVIARADALNLANLIPSTWKRDDSGDIEMKPEDLEKMLKTSISAAVVEALAPVNKRLDDQERAIRLAKMSDRHKAYMEECDEETKKAFGDCKDDAERDAFMDKKPPVKKAAPVDQGALGAELAKRDKQIADQGATITDLQKRLAAVDLEKAQADFKKRAAAIGLTKDGDGELMRKAFNGDAEAQKAYEARLAEVQKAAEEQARVGKLFGEFGTNVAQPGSALGILNAKADELRKTEAGAKLTKEQAFAKVYEDNPELAQREKDERNKRLTVVAA